MMLRSFIAVEMPAEVQQAIARSTAGLQSSLPKPLVRWVPSHNVHLTLKFLGDVSETHLERLAEALKTEAGLHAAFQVAVAGIGGFPNTHRPRVIWIGLQAPADLVGLQRGVDGISNRLGYPAEERPFSPHLTIGRVGQNASPADLARIRNALEQAAVGELGLVRVAAVILFKSDLQPNGSIYTPLYTLPLGG
jgi:2'-5' RNA ligase